MSTPNGWDEALIAAGFTDRRSGKGPSWTALAEAIGKHPSTLTAMRDGTRKTDQATIDAVAKALRLDPRLIAKWAGRARSETDPYVPPSEANLLDRDERDAVDRLISLLVRPRMTGDSSDGRQSDAEKSDDEGGGVQNVIPDVDPQELLDILKGLPQGQADDLWQEYDATRKKITDDPSSR